jgi:hypothetical protein
MTSPRASRHWVRHAMSTAERELLKPSSAAISLPVDSVRKTLSIERAAFLEKIFRSNPFLIYL